MADSMYAATIQALGSGGLDLSSGTFKVVACSSAYSANMGTDDFLADIAGGARIATATLSATFTAGVFDADDVAFPTVAGGSTITQLVIYKDTGDEATSRLIWRIDSYTGLPASTSGTDINVAFPNDGNKIFKIANA